MELDMPVHPGDVPDSIMDEKLGYRRVSFARGIQPPCNRGRVWSMRQYSFADGRRVESTLQYLLEQGQTGLSVAFDSHPDTGMTPTPASPRVR